MAKCLVYMFLCLLLNLIQESRSQASQEVTFKSCPDSDDALCEVKTVRVTPCKEAANGGKKPCKFISGTNATIEFDYVLHFNSDKLVSQAYSATFVDLPLIGMERDACKSTKCPAKADEMATYKNSIFMSPTFPLLNYNVKWRMWDAREDHKGCCFVFKIKLASK